MAYRRRKGIITEVRAKSANVKVTVPTEEAEEPAKASKPRSKSASIPKRTNPRDHPMVKLVGKVRVEATKARKIRSSMIGNPDEEALGPLMEQRQKRKKEKLEKCKVIQCERSKQMDEKVSEYYSRNPISPTQDNDVLVLDLEAVS